MTLRTRTASLGSLPLIAPALAVVKLSTSSISTTTKHVSSSTSSRTLLKRRWTSFPDSLNHLLMIECEFISTSLPCVYLIKTNKVPEVSVSSSFHLNRKNPYRSDSLMASFCAKARHNEVLPVPGGPCNKTTLSSPSQRIQLQPQRAW